MRAGTALSLEVATLGGASLCYGFGSFVGGGMAASSVAAAVGAAGAFSISR